MKLRRGLLCLAAFSLTVVSLFVNRVEAQEQKIDRINTDRVQQMLRDSYDEVRKNYYDKSYHGLDWDAKYHEFDGKIKQITTLAQGLSLVAGLMMTLNDSHTFFLPPSRPVRVEYGFHLQMIGDRAFITRVRSGTDAEAKVHVGDEVIAYNRYNVDRDSSGE